MCSSKSEYHQDTSSFHDHLLVVFQSDTFEAREKVLKKIVTPRFLSRHSKLKRQQVRFFSVQKQVESLSGETSIEYFNDVPITDSRVYNLCLHAGYYLPYHLLTECLKR